MPLSQNRSPIIHRLIAVMGAALIMLLVVLAASPELHARVDGNGTACEHGDHGHGVPVGLPDHVCAVTLFASVVEALLIFCLLLMGLTVRHVVARPTDEIIPARPHYWLVPSHAPPLV